jgi:hypothetical protein
MTRSLRRSRSGRAQKEGQHPGVAPRDGVWLAALVAWLLARPLVDRGLSAFLRAPRVLMALVAVVGLALTILAIVPLVAARPASSTAHPTNAGQVATPTAAADRHSEQAAVLAVIAGYNQASIAAGLLARTDLLAPYLAPEGTAWRDVQAAYERRRARGETIDAALTRWGVLHVRVTSDSALVETQEQWDVVTSVGGVVISSRRGVLTRNAYSLRRSPQAGWLIVAVESTTLRA